MNKRVIEEAMYIKDNNATIREAAKEFKLGKSTVHKDISKRLKLIDSELYEQVREVLAQHLKTRHLKGGEVTRKKYSALGK